MAESRPLILFRTPYFRGPVPLDGVPPELRGHFTADRGRLAEADAVVFHIPDWRPAQLADTPKYPGQLWVAWSQESAANYPRLADPAFLGHFDLRITYERTADIWAPYLPKPDAWRAAQAIAPPGKTETAPLVMFQSAAIDACGRNGFSRALMRHIPIDSYGRLYRNRTLAVDHGRPTKLETIARYRFCLSLENSIVPNYVTEKLFDPLMAGTVPVYRGAPDAADFVPDHSFIDAEAHGGPEGLAAYLRHLIETPEEYEAYLAWRRSPLPARVREAIEASATSCWVRLLDAVSRARTGRRAGLPSFPFGVRPALSARSRRIFRHVVGKPEKKVELR